MRSTGPLYKQSRTDLEAKRLRSFPWYERLDLILGLYRVRQWLSQEWNKMDALMLAAYYSSVVLRFALPNMEFDTVRIMFAMTLMLFYFRVLRMSYIHKMIGPRIITIQAMVRTLCA